jgi:peptidoglycan/xylan/chitin deacetylase (PgdA/CDA1 family)
MYVKNRVVLTFFILFSFTIAARAAELPFTVMSWNGYKSAVSLTFDDGDPIHLDFVIPEMRKRNQKATFFLISDKILRPDDWKKAATEGMEIGNHSANHRHASELSAEDEKHEVDDAEKFLQKEFNQPVATFAYPFVEIKDSLKARIEKNCIAARGGGGNYYYTPVMEPDWYNISSQGTTTASGFDTYKSWIDQALDAGAWTVFMIHAVEGSDWYQPVPKDVFINTLDYLEKNNKDVWTASFGEISAYWKAQKIVETAAATYVNFKDGSKVVSWVKPVLFPGGVSLKIAPEKGYILTQSGKAVPQVLPGVYEISFDVGRVTAEKAGAGKPGFYTEGKKILAPGGEEVILRGVNKMFVWTDKEGATLPEIAKTGANCVRIVWTTKDGTREELDELITKCIENKMIPIIELHDKTCRWDDDVFKDLTAYWTNPETVKIVKKHEKYLMINYGNEIGTWTVAAGEFEKKYSEALGTMRKAGIHVPVIIDSVKCGQDMNLFYSSAAAIRDADPDKNVIFSVHMWWPDNDPARIQDALTAASFVDAPLIVGEFAAMGIGCSNLIAYKTILEECAKTNTGWLAWSWGPGNKDCNLMDMTKDGKFDTLYGWGKEAALDDEYSIRNTSKIPEYIKRVKVK